MVRRRPRWREDVPGRGVEVEVGLGTGGPEQR